MRLKKLAIAALAAISLSCSAHAGGLFSDDGAHRINLPYAPHNIDWYLRHGYTIARNLSVAGSPDNDVVVFLVNDVEHPTSIMECSFYAYAVATCFVVTDPHYKNGKPIDAGQSQNNDD